MVKNLKFFKNKNRNRNDLIPMNARYCIEQDALEQ